MSKLDGHSLITKQAVLEVGDLCANNIIASNLKFAGLPSDVIRRDILDLSGGHWSDYGQKHHFMRRFDGQSPYEAYTESVAWIKTNALKASQHLSERLEVYAKAVVSDQQGVASRASKKSCGLVSMTVNSSWKEKVVAKNILYGSTSSHSQTQTIHWKSFGNALHALQDSFARGHTTRGEASAETDPGEITYVKMYAGEDVIDHGKYDKQWKGKMGGFSLEGRLAVNASKQLIIIVLNTAMKGDTKVSTLVGWDTFEGKWLEASDKLSTTRDFAIELIEEFQTGIRQGYSNRLTVNFDEEGLASALILRLGTNTQKVTKVFERLFESGYKTDMDDIALSYVKKIKKSKSIAEAVKRDKKLVSLLSKSLDEKTSLHNLDGWMDWATKEEKESVEYLQGKD